MAEGSEVGGAVVPHPATSLVFTYQLVTPPLQRGRQQAADRAHRGGHVRGMTEDEGEM